MGRVHKKKLAEYAEAAENEELNKSNEKETEVEEEKNAEKSSSDSDVDEETAEPEGEVVAKNNAAENEDDDEDFQSVQGDADVEPEKNGNGKKAHKRKATNKGAKKVTADDDSDDEPLNGSSAVKRGRKPAGKATKATKTAKTSGRWGKGKATEKRNQDKEDDEEDEEEYEVKEIVDHKVEHGVSFFLIRWKGYTKDDDTWEQEDTLSCPDLIEKYKKKHSTAKSKKAATPSKKTGRTTAKDVSKEDPDKEWEVDKIIDYAEEKAGRVFRIRWKGFGAKYDTWEPEQNLYCDEIISKFMKRMKSQENVTFKELREGPKKTRRLVNETSPTTNYTNPIGRKSKRANTKKRVYYGDSDD